MSLATKKLGRLSRIRVGLGGYQDAMFGVSFTLEGKGWGVNDHWGFWAERPDTAKWTTAEQHIYWGEMCARLVKLLNEADKQSVDELHNVPIEVTLEGSKLVNWRILEEVL